MKTIFMIATLVLISVSAQAKGGVTTGGGGGGGIAIGETYVLLDLFNEGLEKRGTLASFDDVDSGFKNELFDKGQLSVLDKDVAFELIKKVMQVEMVDPYFAAAIVSSLKILSWRFVDAEFLPTEDIEESDSITGAPIVPLAIRQGQTVAISTPRWKQMDTLNRTALLMHEVLAALSPTNLPADGTRRVVARLFTDRFYLKNETEFQAETLRYFPSVSAVDKLINKTRVRSGTYTRANFAPLDQAFAFEDVRFLPKVSLTSNFYFEPIWIEDRVDRLTPWQRLTGAKTPQPRLVTPLVAGPVYSRLCDTSQQGYQVLRASVAVYELKTWSKEVEGGKVPPRLVWGLREKSLASLTFDTGDTGKIVSCSDSNRIQLKKLELLAETLYSRIHY
ncbi:MAG: hypothetical protein EOP05_01535 [Proteobacteria bacterium]|nr:MAG: hypothetical protein EOP05_01535 [Pseudomonadota bacterium]